MTIQFILSNGDGTVHGINKLQVVCNDNYLLDNGVSKNEPKFAFCLIFSLAHQLCYYSWYICNAIIWHSTPGRSSVAGPAHTFPGFGATVIYYI